VKHIGHPHGILAKVQASFVYLDDTTSSPERLPSGWALAICAAEGMFSSSSLGLQVAEGNSLSQLWPIKETTELWLFPEQNS
jgi:hypothetical protein